MELDLVDAVCGATAVGFESFEEKEESTSTHFHKSIFVPPYYPVDFDKQAALNFQTKESLKASAIANDRLENKVTKSSGGSGEPSTSGRVDATIHFGGPDGPSWEVGGTVSVTDGNGNSVDATGTYNSDGTGSLNVGGERADNQGNQTNQN